MAADPSSLGLNEQSIIAGLGGGIVSALVMRNVTLPQAIASVVVGGITSNYLTSPAVTIMAKMSFDVGPGTAGFIVGLTSMIICQAIIERVRRWKNT